jgi:hypothetical protein
MSRFRSIIISLLLFVMPAQAYAMAGMLICNSTAMTRADVLQPDQDPHAVHTEGLAAGDHANTDCHQSSSAARGDHSCANCALCAMAGSVVVPAVIAFTLLPSYSPKLPELFSGPPLHFPDTPHRVPLTSSI